MNNNSEEFEKVEEFLKKDVFSDESLKTNKELGKLVEHLKNAQKRYHQEKVQDQEIKDFEANRKLRKIFSWSTFGFMCAYIIIALVILVFIGFEPLGEISGIPLATFISTIPASMALFGWILKGLFSQK